MYHDRPKQTIFIFNFLYHFFSQFFLPCALLLDRQHSINDLLRKKAQQFAMQK